LEQEVYNLRRGIVDVERRVNNAEGDRITYQLEQLKVVIKGVADQFQDLFDATLSMIDTGTSDV
jgi:hypothetical protein